MDVATYLRDFTKDVPWIQNESINVIKALQWQVTDIVGVSEYLWRAALVSCSSDQLLNELYEWCAENCAGQYSSIRGMYYFAFNDEHDAVQFRLRWG